MAECEVRKGLSERVPDGAGGGPGIEHLLPVLQYGAAVAVVGKQYAVGRLSGDRAGSADKVYQVEYASMDGMSQEPQPGERRRSGQSAGRGQNRSCGNAACYSNSSHTFFIKPKFELYNISNERVLRIVSSNSSTLPFFFLITVESLH